MSAGASTPAPVRIYFGYRPVDKPWGGANNFIRALRADLQGSGRFELTSSIDADCDLLFMNELGRGPGEGSRRWTLREVERAARGPKPRKLVVRAVNLNRHAFPAGPRNWIFGRWRDRQVIQLLNMADAVIFQSRYQQEFFTDAGYRGSQHTVIHNGAGAAFWVEHPQLRPLDDTLHLVSSTASPRSSKRHEIIARIALIPGVEVMHMGAWPADVSPGPVRRLDMLAPERMLEAFALAHYMLHPAIRDPCPNSIFEAICAGLPVIYNPAPGSSREIVGDCGLALDESDLAATVERARASLQAVRENVLRNRARYRIEHAAARYRSVFEHLVEAS